MGSSGNVLEYWLSLGMVLKDCMDLDAALGESKWLIIVLGVVSA